MAAVKSPHSGQFQAGERSSEIGLKGARARAEKLSPERRSEIARIAAQARWARAKVGKP